MDITMVYVLIIGVCVVALTYLVKELRKRNVISSEDLTIVQQLFSLSVSIIDELNLKNEDKILQISNIVLVALDYAIDVSLDQDVIVEKALERCYELCEEMNIELTDSRKMILTQLVSMGLANRQKQLA